jgi:hypothetical protein
VKRYNIRGLLTHPELYRKIIVQGIIATQAREGIDVTEQTALLSFYLVTEAEKIAFFDLTKPSSDNPSQESRFVTSLRQTKDPARISIPIRHLRNCAFGEIFF